MGERDRHATERLRHLIATAMAIIRSPSGAQERALARLGELADRLAAQRFHLAVVGQFKRGKSTLLNALLGARLAPTGVTPVTTLPMFVSDGLVPELRVTFRSRPFEVSSFPGVSELAAALAEFVSEDHNPRNRRAVNKVEAALPAPFLAGGMQLIDTPGIGSTLRHNTEAAESALPDIDAALFVLSIDPPMTEAEAAYLQQVRVAAVHTLVVVNKVDAVEPADLDRILSFTRDALSEAGSPSLRIFAVSARDALNAKMTSDAARLRASGLPELEVYLTNFLAREKRAALCTAVARKSCAVVTDLRAETEVRRAALRAPVADLRRMIALFREACADFEAERIALQDLLSGERKRLLSCLDASVQTLENEARDALAAALAAVVHDGLTVEAMRAALTTCLSAHFDAAFGRAAERLRGRLDETIAAHQGRAAVLLAKVRQGAADIVQVELPVPALTAALSIERQPYWVGTVVPETLGSATTDMLAWLWPAFTRVRRLKRQLLSGADTAISRNVASLHWSLRQTIDETFRRLAPAGDEQLEHTIAAINGALRSALDVHEQQGSAVAQTAAVAARESSELAAVAEEMTGLMSES